MVNIPTIPAKACDVRANTRVHGTFIVRRKHRGVGKTGKAWLQIVLGDKTGSLDARIWDNADSIDRAIQENDIVDAEGQAVAFMDGVQLKVTKLTLNPMQLDPLDFLPESATSPERLRTLLQQQRDLLREPWLVRLFDRYLEDDDWLALFLRAPAAKSVHHAYLGGLAEHTLSMMALARLIGDHYVVQGIAPLNVDVLVAGAFLHDTGKVEEIGVDAGFSYTDAGRLIGHITLGLDRFDRHVRDLAGFPPDLNLHLRHLILSHHGEYEFGSPRRPKTIEAQILHFVDNMDARVAIFAQTIQAAHAAAGNWTGQEPTLGRHLYRRPIDTGDTLNDR